MLRFLALLFFAALSGNTLAQDWGKLATISSTMGVGANRLCLGEASRGDIGCPAYAPSMTTAGDVSISGNVSANKFIGDGSGLFNIAGASADRIVSGSTSMLAISNTGYVSLTQSGVNTGWFDPSLGLVTIGVSSTGPISGTTGYFTTGLGIGTPPTTTALVDISGTVKLRGMLSMRLDGVTDTGTNFGVTYPTYGLAYGTASDIGFAQSGFLSGFASLRFFTLNAEQMRIDNGGNVGMGTGGALVSAKLSVSGTQVTTSWTSIGFHSLARTPTTALEVSGTVSASNFVGNGSGLTGITANVSVTTGVSGSIVFRDQFGSLYASNTLYISNSTLIIGPAYTWSAANPNTLWVSGGVATDGTVRLGQSQPLYWGTSSNVAITGDASQNYLAVKTSNTEALRIVSSGWVGIGTGTPNTALQVNGGLSANALSLKRFSDGSFFNALSTNATNSSTLYVMAMNTGLNTYLPGLTIRNTGGDNLMSVFTELNTHASRIGVGISEAYPSATLHVSGTALISGTLTATAFVGDGSGLTNIAGASADRIVSGSTSMLAISSTGYVSLTQSGVNTGWFDPSRGLVTIGVSSTGPISGSALYSQSSIQAVASIYAGSGYFLAFGNNTTSTGIQGNSDPAQRYLAFYTGAAEQMRIVSSGNVGIGTSTPGLFKLNVAGDILASGGTYAANGAYYILSNGALRATTGNFLGTSGTTLSVSGTTRISSWTTIASTVTPTAALDVYGTVSATAFLGDGSGLTGIVAAANGDHIASGTTKVTANTNGYVSFTTGGTTTGYMDTAGNFILPGVSFTTAGISSTNGYFSANVGIGAAPTPSYPLYVNGNLRATNFSPSPGNGVYWSGNNKVTGDGTNQYIAFTTSGTEAMRIVSSGWVGIGTTQPSSTLHIWGTNSISGGITIGSTNNNTNRLAIYPSGNGSANMQILGSNNLNVIANNGGTVATFGGASAFFPQQVIIGSAGFPSSTLTISGSILTTSWTGINMLNPATAPLEVSGTISATNVNVAGTITLGRYSSQPVGCSGSYTGMMAMTHLGHVCVCDGSNWNDIGSGYAACSW